LKYICALTGPDIDRIYELYDSNPNYWTINRLVKALGTNPLHIHKAFRGPLDPKPKGYNPNWKTDYPCRCGENHIYR
jgi:hypothetical protein